MKILLNVAGIMFFGFVLFAGFMYAITPEKNENGDYNSFSCVVFGK